MSNLLGLCNRQRGPADDLCDQLADRDRGERFLQLGEGPKHQPGNPVKNPHLF